jgi:hypothetical protein
MRVILAVLLLAIPVAWLGLRVSPEEESSPSGAARAPSRAGSSSVKPGPRATEEAEELPEDEAAASEESVEEGEEELEDAEELEGPGPCIELVVAAQGLPVGNAKVAAARREGEDDITELTPLSVGPEGRRQAWCQPGVYLLVASAPGFAPRKLELTVSAGSTPVARFELDGGHTLLGRVLDKDTEQPIAAAKVLLMSSDGDFGSLFPEHSVTSDAKGLFRVDALATGTYQAEAEAPGHTAKFMDFVVPRPEGLSIELEGISRLEGQVVDGAGAPVPGAKVWVLFHGRYPGMEAPDLTDAQGRFSIEIEEGTYQLGASDGNQSGLHEGEVTVVRGGLVDGLIIRLRPTGSLAGKVFVQANHEPIEGARVVLRQADSGWNQRVISDASGSFRLDQLVPGTYSLGLHRSGFSVAQRADVLIQAGQETSMEFALSRMALVKGSVTDALGRPPEEAYIIAQETSTLRNKPVRLSTSTDGDGQYQLDDLPPGSYRLEARLTMQGKPVVREITVQEGDEAHADFVLPEAMGRVEGVVRRASGGPPLHPVDVEAAFGDSDSTEADADDTGHFTIPLLPGSYRFTATYSDTHEPGPEVPVTVEAGTLSRVTLTVPDTLAETSGVVLNARGEPVQDASVSLADTDELYTSTSTNAGGQFTLTTALSSTGRVVSIHAWNGAEEGDVRDVRVGSQNVVVRLQKAGALRGRIIAARGPPVQGFEIRMTRQEEGGSPPDSMDARPFTGDTFEMVELPVGALDLRASTSDGRSGKAMVQITPGQTASVELSVGRLGSVSGRLVDPTLGPMTRWINMDSGTPAEQAVYTSQGGRFRFIALEPGAHVLELGHRRRLPLTIREGEALELGDVDPATVPMAP